MTNCDIIPPPLRAVRKDHKVMSADLEDIGPPSRPIGNGNGAPDTQLSWIMSSICKKAADTLNN